MRGKAKRGQGRSKEGQGRSKEGQGQALPLLGLALLLTGCGADKPVAQGPPPISARPVVAAAAAGNAPAAAADPLTASASNSPTSTSDPLIGEAGGPGGDPLAGDDPLNGPKLPPQHSQPLSGQDLDAGDGILLMHGQRMPTRNTHWLHGRVRDARVGVLLNSIRLGEFSDLVDRDITPRLRVGINTVTFTYKPASPQASAQIDVLEGEHHPPIPPLASFLRSPATGLSTQDALKPQTQSFTFTAR